MKFVPVVCPKCGKRTERPANGHMIHAACPNRGRDRAPVYVELTT